MKMTCIMSPGAGVTDGEDQWFKPFKAAGIFSSALPIVDGALDHTGQIMLGFIADQCLDASQVGHAALHVIKALCVGFFVTQKFNLGR